ncbi:MAG TPA: acetyl-CoA carboxylase biotin carboxyl carrier protein subunit [Clostridiaceae bacterium]|nr:acetyl-CoA carboxylase biotin carboxyl carrier protein subunit [Clostridiaceae bacterium]
MRKFIVNVNGNSYEVEVEEVGVAPVSAPAARPAQPVSAPAPAAAAPAAAPAPAEKPAAPAPAGTEGSIKITAPMPGTILDIKVKPGDKVSKGTLVMILEAMKMENEILSPEDATVASVNVTKGQQVNTGDVMMTLN